MNENTPPSKGPERSSREETVMASDFTVLLNESARLAEAEAIVVSDLDEMDAINQMRIVAESIAAEDYVFHTSS